MYISSMSENGLDYDNLTRIVYFPAEKDSPLDVLHNGLRLIQKALQVGDAAPEVWFVLRGTQVGDWGGVRKCRLLPRCRLRFRSGSF